MPNSVRTTVSLPKDQYREVARIAKDQHVSTAWVIRDALRSYIAARYPLLESASSNRDVIGIGAIAKRKKLPPHDEK